jgi:hypothetical protein
VGGDLVAKHELLDLSGWCLRELGHEKPLRRDLESGHLSFTEGLKLGSCRWFGIGAKPDHRGDVLTPPCVGDA